MLGCALIKTIFIVVNNRKITTHLVQLNFKFYQSKYCKDQELRHNGELFATQKFNFMRETQRKTKNR